MSRLLYRALARPTFVLFGVVLVLAGLGLFAQALVLSPVTPDAGMLLRLGLAALGGSVGLAVPIGVLAAVAEGGRRLREEGAWCALGALGASGLGMLSPLLVWLGLWALVSAAVGHFAEPWSRASLRDLRAESAGQVELLPGRTTRVGPWSVAVDEGRLHFAGEGVLGSAGSWRFVPSAGAITVELGAVEARSVAGDTQFFAETARIPVPLSGDGLRVHVSELDTPAMLAHWEDHAPAPYERWIGWKRSVLPLAMVLVGLALFPFSVGPQGAVARWHPSGWSPLMLTGVAFAGLWSLIRGLDQAVVTLGPPAATAALIGGLGIVAASAWATWADR